jgi:hypothetical protein
MSGDQPPIQSIVPSSDDGYISGLIGVRLRAIGLWAFLLEEEDWTIKKERRLVYKNK